MSEFTSSELFAEHERKSKGTEIEHGWCGIADLHYEGYAHVIPLNDKRKHSEDIDEPCWCHTTLDESDPDSVTTVVVHNSSDGREFAEPNFEHRGTVQ